MKNPSILVAHPFQQHSFQLAAALKKNNYDFKYSTTVYLKKGTVLRKMLFLLKGEAYRRACGRRTDVLCDQDVIVFGEIYSLGLLLIQRLPLFKAMYNWWYWKTVEHFNSKLFKYVKKNGIDIVILYDTVARSFIQKAKASGLSVKTIIDMSAASVGYTKSIFKNENISNARFANPKLHNNRFSLIENKNSDYEIQQADAFFVASDFTEKSLTSQGVSKAKIFKCVYGVDDYIVADIEKETVPDSNKLICVFSGNVCMEKGAFRLFNVIDKLDLNKFEFHFFGHYSSSSSYYPLYKNKVFFHGHIIHEEFVNFLKRSDVLVFPSFADGFGLSVIEAMANENAVICSCNAGVSEIITEDVGFVVPPSDEEGMVKHLNYLSENRNVLEEMKINSKKRLANMTWSNYYSQVNNALRSIIKECNDLNDERL